MKEYTLKDHVKSSVYLDYYQNGVLWYRAQDTDFLFPVPTEGCEELLKAVELKKSRYHVFEHIHRQEGEVRQVHIKDTIYINASTCDEYYNSDNIPIVIEI